VLLVNSEPLGEALVDAGLPIVLYSGNQKAKVDLDLHSEQFLDLIFNKFGLVYLPGGTQNFTNEGWAIMLVVHEEDDVKATPVLHRFREPAKVTCDRLFHAGFVVLLHEDEKGLDFLDGSTVVGWLIRPAYYCKPDHEPLQ